MRHFTVFMLLVLVMFTVIAAFGVRTIENNRIAQERNMINGR